MAYTTTGETLSIKLGARQLRELGAAMIGLAQRLDPERRLDA